MSPKDKAQIRIARQSNSCFVHAGLELECMGRQTSVPNGVTDVLSPPIHDQTKGHRARLKERFHNGGAQALADYEMLELVLFRSIPRRDVKPLAKQLIARFGGFAEVLGASDEQLLEMPGISHGVALDLKVVLEAARRLSRDRVMTKPVLSSYSKLVEYCRAFMADEAKEQFRVLFLDRRNRLIADEVMGRGSIAHAPVYPREVAHRALTLNASAIILAHNHPSGDPTPSQADIDMTVQIADTLTPLGIVVHDHLIIGRECTASFKQLELL